MPEKRIAFPLPRIPDPRGLRRLLRGRRAAGYWAVDFKAEGRANINANVASAPHGQFSRMRGEGEARVIEQSLVCFLLVFC